MKTNSSTAQNSIMTFQSKQLQHTLKHWLIRIDNYIQLASDLLDPTFEELDEYFDNSYDFIDNLYHKLKKGEALSLKEKNAIRMTLKETEKMAIANNISY